MFTNKVKASIFRPVGESRFSYFTTSYLFSVFSKLYKFIGELRNISDEQLTKLRDEISNSNLTDATKQSMLEVLDNIHKIETTTQKERSDMDVRTKEVLEKAEDFLSEVTDQVLDSLDTIEDVKDLMEEIRNIFNPIAGNKDNSELTEFYRERYTKLQEKLRKLEAEDDTQSVISSTFEFASNTLLDTTTNIVTGKQIGRAHV